MKSKLKCNKPTKSWRAGKKKVVKACANGREKIIHFGASGYGHNYSPEARRSFRARHKCDKAKDKLSARYWACKNLWTKGGSKKRCPSNKKCKKARMSFVDECDKCSNSDEPIELEPIDAKSVGVFLFKQNDKCWCYMVNNLYRAVFDTTVPTTIENARIKNNKNPLTGMPIDGKILQRLVKEYAEWYRAKRKR